MESGARLGAALGPCIFSGQPLCLGCPHVLKRPRCSGHRFSGGGLPYVLLPAVGAVTDRQAGEDRRRAWSTRKITSSTTPVQMISGVLMNGQTAPQLYRWLSMLHADGDKRDRSFVMMFIDRRRWNGGQ